MAYELHARGTSFALHYTGRSHREMAFLNQLQKKWGSAFTSYSKSDGERMPVIDILGDAPRNAVIYVCGPDGLIEGTREAAETLGLAPEQVQYERFAALQKPDDRAFTLELRRSQKTISVRANQSLLEAIEGAGVKALSSCRTGTCRTCVVKVLDGEADHRDSASRESERNDEKLICPCVSRAASDHLILDS